MTKARDLANAGTALTSVSATELGYLDGVTSAVQTQLNAKQPTVSGVSDTEIGYLDGVTSAIQTQLDAKVAASNGTFTAIGGAEGGQINIAAAPTGGTGAVATIDVYETALRITPDNFTTLVRLGSDYATTGSNSIRNITISTSDPSGGNNGDVWIKYTA